MFVLAEEFPIGMALFVGDAVLQSYIWEKESFCHFEIYMKS